MKYDDAEYYFLNFQTDLAQEKGGTAIGFYLAWLLLKGHGGEDTAEAVEDLRSRQRTGVQVLFDDHDGALLDDDFDDHGNAFTAAYYDQHYFGDYEAVFARDFPNTGHPTDDVCNLPASWENQDRMSAMLDRRWAQWEAGQPFAPLPAAAAPAPIRAAPPLADGPMPSMAALLDQMQDGLRRFLGFEAFIDDRVNDQVNTPTRHGRSFLSEFPGGCHWIELVAHHEPVEGGVRYGMSVMVRSRIQDVVEAIAAIEVPGFARMPDAGGDLYDSVYMWLPSWWGEGPSPCRDVEGESRCVYFRDAAEIAPAIAHLARQAEGPLRKLLRQFETVKGLEAVLNASPLTQSPIFLSTRMIQNVHLAEAMRNPRLHAICDEVERLSARMPPSPDIDALRTYIHVVRARNANG